MLILGLRHTSKSWFIELEMSTARCQYFVKCPAKIRMAQFFSSENDLYFMSSSGKVKAFPQASFMYRCAYTHKLV